MSTLKRVNAIFILSQLPTLSEDEGKLFAVTEVMNVMNLTLCVFARMLHIQLVFYRVE